MLEELVQFLLRISSFCPSSQAERLRRWFCNQKIAGSNPASGHLATPERRSKLDSERLCNQAPSVYCGALKLGAS